MRDYLALMVNARRSMGRVPQAFKYACPEELVLKVGVQPVIYVANVVQCDEALEGPDTIAS